MLENLINLVKEHAGDAIINNPAVPNEHNDAVIAEAGHTIENGLKNMIAQGKLNDVLSLFHNQAGISSNPAVQNISSSLIQNLTSKFGLNQSAANGIASSLIPNVLQSLVGKTNNPADNSFNLEGIISHLTNGQNLNGLLNEAGGSNMMEGLMQKVTGLFSKA